MAGFTLPPQVDPNYRVAADDPQRGLHAFTTAWHDVWTFITTISRDLYTNFRAVQDLSDRS